MKPPVPPGLLTALDVSLDSETTMRPEDIIGVARWLGNLIALNADDMVNLSVNELLLISSALNDAIGAPISRIREVSR
jgi:hypothetical protein